MIDPKLKTYIIGLLLTCPIASEEDNCPLKNQRNNMSLNEKIDFVDQLSLESAVQIIQLHKDCANERKVISNFNSGFNYNAKPSLNIEKITR